MISKSFFQPSGSAFKTVASKLTIFLMLFSFILGFGQSSKGDPGDEDLVPWPFELQCPIIWKQLEGTWIIRASSHSEMPTDHFKIEILQEFAFDRGFSFFRFQITRHSQSQQELSMWEGYAEAGSQEWRAFLVRQSLDDESGEREQQNESQDLRDEAEYFDVVIRVFDESLALAKACTEKELMTVITLKREVREGDKDLIFHYLLEKQSLEPATNSDL